MDYIVPAQFAGLRPHRHEQTAEAVYVLEGRVTFQIGERIVKAPAGTFIYIPAGLVHTFSNPRDEAARLLILTSPVEFEHYAETLANVMGERASWSPVDTGKLRRLVSAYAWLKPSLN